MLYNLSRRKSKIGFDFFQAPLIPFCYGIIHAKGDHAILQKAGCPTLSIPFHKDVARFLLKSQIRRAKLTLSLSTRRWWQ